MGQEAKQALELMVGWQAVDVVDALELLSPAFQHPLVRKYAVSRLRQADDEVCILLEDDYLFHLLLYLPILLIRAVNLHNTNMLSVQTSCSPNKISFSEKLKFLNDVYLL